MIRIGDIQIFLVSFAFHTLLFPRGPDLGRWIGSFTAPTNTIFACMIPGG